MTKPCLDPDPNPRPAKFVLPPGSCDCPVHVIGLPLPVVVDHMGHMNTGHGIDHTGFQALLDLVGQGVCWVKLSGNYRISAAGPLYADAQPFARALIAAGPERMLWGSDWPHPALHSHMPNDGDLFDALDDYAPEAELKCAILVDNPARLYGFDK